MPRALSSLILIVSLSASAIAADTNAQGENGEQDHSAAFNGDIAPLLQRYCADCHNAKVSKAKFRIDDIQLPSQVPADVARWEKILEMVSIGDMPPSKKPQPSKAERKQLINWISTSFLKLGRKTDENAHAFPHFANRVDHDELFTGEHKGPAFTSSRVWRMSPHIYKEMLTDLSLNEFTVPLTTVPGEGFDDYALLSADEATIGTLIQNAKRTAITMILGKLTKPRGSGDKKRENKAKRSGTKHRVLADFAKLESSPTKAQMEEVVTYTFKILLQRAPSKEELDRYVANSLAKNVEVGGNELGLRGFLVSVLISPEFLFRMEVGLGKKLADGRRMLSSHELAYALSFALYDRPIDSLIKAANAGKLATREDVLREAKEMLYSPKHFRGQIPAARRKMDIWPVGKLGVEQVDKPRMLRFFREFFDYAKAVDVFKDETRHGGAHRARDIVLDADWLVLEILHRDKQVFKELLTTDRFVINGPQPPKKQGEVRGYERVYNVKVYDWTTPGSTKMPEGQRAGILTHPAWLVAHSGNFENDPVRRGKWIQQHLLGGVVPDIPIGVEAQLPERPEQTLRQRFEIVNGESCWRCHKKMNPLGNPFEMYDDFGSMREKHHVTLEGHVVASEFEVKRHKSKLTAEPKIDVNTTGELIGTGDAKLDGDVKDPIDLVQRLAQSDRVRQVIIRHAFRYWMGRNESLNDSPTLMAMDRAYVESDGSFRATLLALFTSDSFLYRK